MSIAEETETCIIRNKQMCMAENTVGEDRIREHGSEGNEEQRRMWENATWNSSRRRRPRTRKWKETSELLQHESYWLTPASLLPFSQWPTPPTAHNPHIIPSSVRSTNLTPSPSINDLLLQPPYTDSQKTHSPHHLHTIPRACPPPPHGACTACLASILTMGNPYLPDTNMSRTLRTIFSARIKRLCKDLLSEEQLHATRGTFVAKSL